LSNIPGTVITLGDNAYSSGTRAQFANCYDNYRLSDGSTHDSSRTTYWGKEPPRPVGTGGTIYGARDRLRAEIEPLLGEG
jgi:hypothetical protein